MSRQPAISVAAKASTRAPAIFLSSLRRMVFSDPGPLAFVVASGLSPVSTDSHVAPATAAVAAVVDIEPMTIGTDADARQALRLDEPQAG
ncbi:hypothetical protein PPNSA23_45970 [Phyllobacterium phragmitis]|uniref:Uncharacterized protein n=1 Tax=Phyllobacterium phragmitis TaxID=2670329 RepID=A0ABQ0H6V5_9HYPH